MNLTADQWALGVVAALLVGFVKSGVPGLGILIVPVMAAVFPAKQSVGVLLPMLVAGDLFAVAYYRRHALWPQIWRLLAGVAPGMVLAVWTLRFISDGQLKSLLGGMILVLVGLELARQKFSWQVLHHWSVSALAGVVTGFATTVGNLAGPVAAVYFVSKDLDKKAFLGTFAWLFLILNATKLPIFAGLGMITPASLWFDALMLPAIAVGAVAGRWALPRIPETLFARLVLILAAVAGLQLLLR
jgi:uncharacterized membrane protein YfcA